MSRSAFIPTVVLLALAVLQSTSLAQHVRFNVLVLASKDHDHARMISRAEPLLENLGREQGFTVDLSRNTGVLTDSNLARYQVIVQLQQAPFELTPAQQGALQHFVEHGRGWVGIHAAGLTGRQFIDSSTAYWQWFEDFFGGVVYSPHPALQTGTIRIEDHSHPATRNLPDSFAIVDEWYEFDRSPRPNVRVLGVADESTYKQNVPMGDHPLIWTNEKYDRMIYIGTGHDASACDNPAFVTLLRDAILWAATPAPGTLPLEQTAKGSAFSFNQAGYDARGPKIAVAGSALRNERPMSFAVIDAANSTVAFSGTAGPPEAVDEWTPGRWYYRLDFSPLRKGGSYRLRMGDDSSGTFIIADGAFASLLPSIIHYFRKQRADSGPELDIDRRLKVFGSADTVDMRGGWCDASGDVSKYFSHLAYANVMSPQQTPLVAWSLTGAAESVQRLPGVGGVGDSLAEEAIWGADYLMRALSPEGYFRMIVFSYFNKDPEARRVVGLLANSVTTTDYQCAFREGGGMAIAALARISRWKRNGAFTSDQYLQGAQRAFDHLLRNNARYDDDGKENIIDDYCALMAATELWRATDSTLYRNEARKRAANLSRRMTPGGYFTADDTGRPFWHASDAGLPVVALSRYLSKEMSPVRRTAALATIRKALDYALAVTHRVDNPYGYARQTFRTGKVIKEGFFIPHENESGWWWQGENARLGSLATAALVGGRLVYPSPGSWGVTESLAVFASQQLDWILGCNPYGTCFLYGSGTNNVPVMQSQFGHGTERGGISNGITGKEGRGDGTGIDFKRHADGIEWRWTEQWLPHAAWFLQAVTAIAESRPRFRAVVLAQEGGHHAPFVEAAAGWLTTLAADSNLVIDFIHTPDSITTGFLARYQLFIQLDYPPYGWNDRAREAFETYINAGTGGGWLGFHHATLLGEFDGYPMWQWFSDFMGGIRYTNYIATFAEGTVRIEDRSHPVMRGVPETFQVTTDEWYTYDKSPRGAVHVLANVNESTYSPASDIVMGDHPVIWTNEHVGARNLYIFMGHHPNLFENPAYTTLVRNAIFWAARKYP